MYRRLVLALLSALVCVSGTAYSNNDKDHSHKNHSSKRTQQPRITKDGAVNPNSIPELVAYEFFLGSLLADPKEGEQGKQRARAFALKSGLSVTEADALLFNAAEFSRTISAFDKQVREIKDRTWPNPSKETWGQLRNLQARKEAAMMQSISTLLSRFSAQARGKLATHISRVKMQVKGYADEPNIPGQRPKTALYKSSFQTRRQIAYSKTLSPFISARPIQMGDGTVYLYSDTAVSLEALAAFGYGSVSASSDSYGHIYTVRTETLGPELGMQATGVNNTYLPLEYLGDIQDGNFNTVAIGEQFCPIANATNDAGSSYSSEFVAPFFTLGPFDPWVFDQVSNNQIAHTAIRVSASKRATGSPSLELGTYPIQGQATWTFTGDGQVSGLAPGKQIIIQCGYKANVQAGPVKITAAATLSANIQVVGSPQTGSHVLTVNP